MEEQQPPTLSLQIIKGPRKGETLQFRPGYAIRIGRVVCGNNLPIKDPGISTKHLSIHTESGKWALRDLDSSSNGTSLDDAVIPPNTSFYLRDGSTIKIGEVTVIVVNFIHPEDKSTNTTVERGRRGKKVEEPKSIRVTRNMTRNMKNIGVEIGESSCLIVDGLENVVKEKMKGGGRKGKKKLEEDIFLNKLEEEIVGDGKENCDEAEEKEKYNWDGNMPDLEKMSLGEWFDFLEVYLPKQIHDETEDIIDSMRQKAERLREYVMMHENQKAQNAPGIE